MNTVQTSLVITTFNRADLLRSALRSVAKSRVDNHDGFEVIVVDNNSTDHTSQVVETFQVQDFPFTLRYIFESHQGLSWARNRAIGEAKGQYIVFMDDDQLIDEYYLARVDQVFRDTHAAAVGGPLIYYNKDDVPSWLAPLLDGIEGRSNGDQTRVLDLMNGKLTGGNMAFDRRELIDIGQFNVNLGRTGDSLLGAEEDEVQERLHVVGKLIVYCPDLIQHHYLSPERRTKRYWRRHHFGAGRTDFRRSPERPKAGGRHAILGAPRWLWRALLARDIPRALWSLLSTNSARRFGRQLDVCFRLGQIYEARHGRAAPGKTHGEKASFH